MLTTPLGARLAPAEGALTRVLVAAAEVTMLNVLPDFFAESPEGPPAEAEAAARPLTSTSIKRMRRNARAMASSGFGTALDIGATPLHLKAATAPRPTSGQAATAGHQGVAPRCS